jgi:hypothetical protein
VIFTPTQKIILGLGIAIIIVAIGIICSSCSAPRKKVHHHHRAAVHVPASTNGNKRAIIEVLKTEHGED